MLRGKDLQDSLIDESALPTAAPDRLAGPFAHVVVDEAQELTDAEWQMLLLRCPSRSFTVVGDRAQARHGFAESWEERLKRVGLDRIEMASLGVNYRTPEEVMAEAEPVIRAALPDANVPTSIRSSGVPVVHGPVEDRDAILAAWLDEHAEGVACVIGDPTFRATSRVRSLTPELSKGLEFDLVVLVDPETFGDGIEGAVDRYVAMTRATQRLVVLRSSRGRPRTRLPRGRCSPWRNTARPPTYVATTSMSPIRVDVDVVRVVGEHGQVGEFARGEGAQACPPSGRPWRRRPCRRAGPRRP